MASDRFFKGIWLKLWALSK